MEVVTLAKQPEELRTVAMCNFEKKISITTDALFDVVMAIYGARID